MGGRYAVLLLGLGALCSACSEPARYLLRSDGARAAVLVTLPPVGGLITARAVALDGPVTFEIDPDTARSLVALRYDATLEILGLPSGELKIGGGSVGLPKGAHVDLLDLEADTLAWTSLPEVPEEVASLRFEDAFGCVQYSDRQVRPSELGHDEFVRCMAESDAEHALFVTSRRRAFELDLAGNVSPVALSTATLPQDAFRTADGEIWMMNFGGKTLHGTAQTGFVEGPAIEMRHNTWIDLDGARGDAPFELYALSSSLAIQRFDGSRWSEIRGERPVRDGRARSNLAWLEPGRVVVIGSGADEAVEVDADGSERVIPLSIPDRLGTTDAVFATRHVRNLGVVVGTRYMVLYLRHLEGSWERLAVPELTPKTEEIIDLGNQSFLAGGSGQLQEWTAGFGLCVANTQASTESFDASLRIGETVILASGGAPGLIFTFLTPTR